MTPATVLRRDGVTLRTLEDPALRRPALRVTRFDRSLRRLATVMFDVLRETGGGSLAANQLGHEVAVLAVHHAGLRVVIVNPCLYDVVSAESVESESCASVPGPALPIIRASGAIVTGWDLGGARLALAVEGRQARTLQHAVDHLRGKLLLDRA
jgi:peptide deformylase